MKKLLLSFIVISLFAFILSCPDEGSDVPEQAEYIGIWVGYNIEVSLSSFNDVVFTINIDGTFESLLYEVGTQTLAEESSRGNYTVNGDIFDSLTTEIYDGFNWIPDVEWYRSLFTIVGDTMNLNVDMDSPPDGVYDVLFVLQRQ